MEYSTEYKTQRPRGGAVELSMSGNRRRAGVYTPPVAERPHHIEASSFCRQTVAPNPRLRPRLFSPS